MKKIIDVPLPINIEQKELSLFQPFTSYEISTLKIKMLHNVFVTHSGLAVGKKGLIKESHYDYPYEKENFLNNASSYYNDAKDNPEMHLILLNDENTYLLIHHPWFNYYHWLCEAILRLWIVRDKKDQMVLILPDYYENTDFIMGSLEPFKLKNIRFIPANKSLLVRNLCLPELKPVCDSYHIDKLLGIRHLYLNYVTCEKKFNSNFGERIYISRKKASRKKVINEDEVEKILNKYNFITLDNEDYCFLEQVSIYSKAGYLISIHGSGLTNMLFMKEQSSVLEIHKQKTNTLNRPSFVFWYEAAALGFKYYHQVSDPLTEDDDYFLGNFAIDVKLLEKNILQMLSHSSK